MLNRSLAQGWSAAMLMAMIAVFSSFRSGPASQQITYLHKISSPAGQTRLEYNADKTIRKIVQLHKTENASYSDVQLPVYENGRLVKCLFADEEEATTGDLYTSYDYTPAGDRLTKISFYRNNAVYGYDSLAYNAAGQLATRYQFGKNPGSCKWEKNGYQQYTWDGEGNVSRMENFGKQPGYSRFINTSTVTYTYDKSPNPQQPELANLLDASAANLSAHNILTETVSSRNSSRAITSTYSYAYNAGKYPVRGTYTSGLDASVVKLEWIKLQ